MSVRKDAYAWVGVGIIGFAIVISAVMFIRSQYETVTVRLGDGVFRTWVAASASAHEKGLGGVATLKESQAMLFFHETNQDNKIWMKDMLLSIDAVWLDEGKRVVHIEQGLHPSSYPTRYGPDVPTRYVLELPVGTVQEKRITRGSQAIFDDMFIREHIKRD